MALSAASARTLVRQFARNAGDSSVYSDTDIDNAIAIVGHRFVRKTKCTRTKSTLALTAGSNSLPAFPAGFRPEYILRGRVDDGTTNQKVKFIDDDALLDKRQADARSGLAEFVAFDTFTTGEVYPKPDANATLTFWWYEVFNTTTYNIPDPWLYEVVAYGAVAVLQQNEPENQKWVTAAWAKYLEMEKSATGNGGLGVQEYDAVVDEDDTRVPLFDANGMEE